MRASLCCTDLQSWPSNSTPPLPAWGSETSFPARLKGARVRVGRSAVPQAPRGGGETGEPARPASSQVQSPGAGRGCSLETGAATAPPPPRSPTVGFPFPLHSCPPHAPPSFAPPPCSHQRPPGGAAGSRCVPQGCPGDPSREQREQPLAWQVMQPARG